MNFFNPFRRFKKQEPSKPEHVHSWRAIAVRDGQSDGHVATLILQQCECGQYQTQAQWGMWTLEQAQAGEFSREVVELRKMAGL